MCGRYKLDLDWTEIVRLYTLDPDAAYEDWAPRYNVAPTQRMPILLGDGQLRALPMRWGLLAPWSTPRDAARTINARAESVETTRTFREPFARRRCLVPNTGFYEWQVAGKARIPTLFRPRAGVLAFAGLWQAWRGADGVGHDTFTVLTCPANAVVAPAHDRMPVLVPREAWGTWLTGTPEQARSLLVPAHADVLEAVRVSDRVGNVRNDDPHCAKPLSGIGPLFGG